MRWVDVDLAAGRARVTHTVTAIRWEIHAGQPKTAAGRRPVAPDPATIATLREHHETMLERRQSEGVGHGWVVDAGVVKP